MRLILNRSKMTTEEFAKYQQERRRKKKERGECRECTNPSKGFMQCFECRKLRSEKDRLRVTGKLLKKFVFQESVFFGSYDYDKD